MISFKEFMDLPMNEDVMGMVANGSINMLFKLAEFKDIPRDRVYWVMSHNRVPVFGFNNGNIKNTTTIEIPFFTTSAELMAFPKESRVGLAKQLKQAMGL